MKTFVTLRKFRFQNFQSRLASPLLMHIEFNKETSKYTYNMNIYKSYRNALNYLPKDTEGEIVENKPYFKQSSH